MTGPSTPASDEDLDEIAARIDSWAERELADNPVVAAVERTAEADGRRWFIRFGGEEKDVSTLWLWLRQRTLHHETYVMPAPEENEGRLYEHLLRRNQKLHAMAFAIGIEDAIFLQGQIPVDTVDDDELDRILGATYATVEQCFRPAMRIGFASRFTG